MVNSILVSFMVRIRSSISFGFIGPPNDAPAIISIMSTFSHLRFIDTDSSGHRRGNRVNLLVDATRPQSLLCCVGPRPLYSGLDAARGYRAGGGRGEKAGITRNCCVVLC